MKIVYRSVNTIAGGFVFISRGTTVNGHLGLIHSILPATVDLQVTIPDSHPSTRNLGSERVGSGTIVDPDGYILTVHYVTVGASTINVTLFEGERSEERRVG